MLPEKDQATTIGNMYRKFGEVQLHGFALHKQTNRQTYSSQYFSPLLGVKKTTVNHLYSKK